MKEGKRGELGDASVHQTYPNILPRPSQLGSNRRDVTIPLSLHLWSLKARYFKIHIDRNGRRQPEDHGERRVDVI
jgi:hypothetical protein